MLSPFQLQFMLNLQDRLNKVINPNWLTAGYPYLRAAMLEAGEGIEHHGWKWWKSQKMNKGQLQMELVDIWHFVLSHWLVVANGDANAVIGHVLKPEENPLILFDGNYYDPSQMDLVGKLELCAGLCVSRRFSFPLFDAIRGEAELSWDELFIQYAGKNLLNLFRQSHGYNEAPEKYKKHWFDGREDNEHLTELLATFQVEHPQGLAALTAALEERYSRQ